MLSSDLMEVPRQRLVMKQCTSMVLAVAVLGLTCRQFKKMRGSRAVRATMLPVVAPLHCSHRALHATFARLKLRIMYQHQHDNAAMHFSAHHALKSGYVPAGNLAEAVGRGRVCLTADKVQ